MQLYKIELKSRFYGSKPLFWPSVSIDCRLILKRIKMWFFLKWKVFSQNCAKTFHLNNSKVYTNMLGLRYFWIVQQALYKAKPAVPQDFAVRQTLGLPNKGILFDNQCLARFYRIELIVGGEPNGYERGIVDSAAVGAENKRIVCRYIIVNLNICRIPNIGLSGKLFADSVKQIPIFIVFKLKAVPPKVEKPGSLRRVVRWHWLV